MIAVGIDVSKSKSTVAILDSYGTVLATPFNMAHTQPEMNALVFADFFLTLSPRCPPRLHQRRKICPPGTEKVSLES